MSTSLDTARDQLYTALLYYIKHIRTLELQHLVFGDQSSPTVRAEVVQLHQTVREIVHRLADLNAGLVKVERFRSKTGEEILTRSPLEQMLWEELEQLHMQLGLPAPTEALTVKEIEARVDERTREVEEG